MANGKVGVEITNLNVARNGMTGRADVANRFLFQWAHPVKQDDNPLTSFTVSSIKGPVPAPEMSAAAPGGVVSEGQKFRRKPGEPLELQIHHFLDVKRDFLQIIEGKLIEDLADLLVNSVNVGPISLSRLIDPASQLKLSDDTYSLPIGFHSAVVQPLALGAQGATLTFATNAAEDVFVWSSPVVAVNRMCG